MSTNTIMLRPYQTEAVDRLQESIAPNSRVLNVLPTGAGKSVVIADLVRRQYPEDGSIVIATHRKELVAQTSAILRAMDIPHSLYSAGLNSRLWGKVTIGNIQSMVRSDRPPANTRLVIIDEAHRVVFGKEKGKTKTYERLMDMLKTGDDYPALIGLTATPFYGTRKTLVGQKTFERIVHQVDVDDLIHQGYLSPLECFQGVGAFDESKLARKSWGERDFTEESQEIELEKALPAIVGDIVEKGENYKKWAVFLPSKKSCRQMANMLTERGVSTRIILGDSQGRDEIIHSFRKPDTDIRCIVSCNVLCEGFDVPDIDLIVLARATTSPLLYVQAVGRGMRIAENKNHCRVLDYGGNVMRHGPINDLQLDNKAKSAGRMKECPKCRMLISVSARECSYCGHEYPIRESKPRNPKLRIHKFTKIVSIMKDNRLQKVEHPDYPGAVMRKVDGFEVRYYKSKMARRDQIMIQYFTHDRIFKEYNLIPVMRDEIGKLPKITEPTYTTRRWVRYLKERFDRKQIRTMYARDILPTDKEFIPDHEQWLIHWAGELQDADPKPMYIWTRPQRDNPHFTEIVAREYSDPEFE